MLEYRKTDSISLNYRFQYFIALKHLGYLHCLIVSFWITDVCKGKFESVVVFVKISSSTYL